MLHRRRVLALLAGAVVASVLGARGPRAEVPEGGYRVLVLPGGPGAPRAFLAALNASGAAAGWTDDFEGNPRASIWDPAGRGRIALRLLREREPWSRARDLNDAGAAAGESSLGEEAHAVFWASRSAVPEDLGTLGGPNSVALGLNEGGEIVGNADTETEPLVPFYRPAGGLMTRLPLPEGLEGGSATEISDSGTIIGYAFDPLFLQPLMWATPNAEPEILPLPEGAFNGQPRDISDDGSRIAGFASEPGGRYVGILWVRDGDGAYVPTRIAAEEENLLLSGLNNAGDAVGRTFIPGGASHAILVRAGSTRPVTLNSQLMVGSRIQITSAGDINGSGMISGAGIPRGGEQDQGVILTSGAPDLRADWQRATKRRIHRSGVSFWVLGGRVRVRNQGDADSGRFRVRIFLSRDRRVGGGDLELAQRSYLSLAKGTTDVFNWDYALEPGSPDPRGKYLYALVDGPNTVLETNEGNNVAFFGRRVP